MAVKYDLYTTTDAGVTSTLVAADINTGEQHTYLGTTDFFVKSRNEAGDTLPSNIEEGTGAPGALPGSVTDFAASDGQEAKIEMTWTPDTTASPVATYDLWDSTGVVQVGIDTGYVLNITGTENYYLKVINIHGTTSSNADAGTGQPLIGIFSAQFMTNAATEFSWIDVNSTGTGINVSEDAGLTWTTHFTATVPISMAADCEVEKADGSVNIHFFTSAANAEKYTGTISVQGSGSTLMSQMFERVINVSSIDLTGFDTTNVTDMSRMLFGCTGLTSFIDDGWDTSNVTNYNSAFAWLPQANIQGLADSLTVTSACTNMTRMFYDNGMSSLDLTHFDTSQVTIIQAMFSLNNSLTFIDLSGWDLTNLNDCSSMFASATSIANLNLTGLDFGNATNYDNMFNNCTALVCISNIHTSNGAGIKDNMFNGCVSMTQPDSATQDLLVDDPGFDFVGAACP